MITKGTKLMLAHLAGDYILQSHWMSQKKTSEWTPALAHGLIYGACHLTVTRSPAKLAVIAGTHAVIDRYRLAKHVSWAKNQVGPKGTQYPWGEPTKANNGFPEDTPPWLSTWLMIITDNAIHLAINALTTKDDK